MFKTDLVAKKASFTSYCVQQIGSVVLPLIWALATSSLPAAVTQALGFGAAAVVTLVWQVSVWGFGLGVGYVIQCVFPDAVLAGRWVWILPTVLAGAAILRDGLLFSASHALHEFFWPPSQGEASWAVMVVSYPVCSSILYSLGTSVASKRSRKRSLV